MREERFEKSGLPVLLPGEMHDSGVVFVTCPEGHRSAALYNHRKHEIFFASGAMALFDGYSNEAVSSFATALERLYEFYIRVVCRKRGIAGTDDRHRHRAELRRGSRQGAQLRRPAVGRAAPVRPTG